MMTDAMKFGPEWLRNLSQDGCSQPTISSTPRYQLAEHRYGREEMLALFDRMVKAPDNIVGVPALYVEKTQPPLALLQMTEEETRMWNRGINSDAVLRSTSKTPAGISGVPRGGRGGSVDRGRGRGRGSYHYSRGLSYEEPGDSGDVRSTRAGPERGEGGGNPSANFQRTLRSYDRSQGPATERNWSERNGADPGDWNGSTSPRKDFSGRGFMENWRRHRGGGEDDDGWRTNSSRSDKWGSSSYPVRPNSWRDNEKDGLDSDHGGRTQGWDRGRGWDESGAPSAHHPHRRPWDEDNLPEWAMENPSESGGSFDASGAFHGGGGLSDEEEVDGRNAPGSRGPREPRARLLSEGNSSKRPQPGRRIGGLPRDTGLSRSTEEEPHRSEDSGADRLVPGAAPVPVTTVVPSTTKKSSSPNVTDNGKRTSPLSNPKSEEDVLESNHVLTDSISAVTKPVDSVPSRKLSVSNSLNSQQNRKSSSEAVPVPVTSTSNVSKNVDVSRYSTPSEEVSDSIQKHQQTSRPVGRQKSEDDMERMQEVADDLVAKLMDDEEGHDKTMPSVDGLTGVASQQTSDKWFYRDPQGEVQGPFSAAEMAEWFRSGYFQLNLLVRRSCDERFCELGGLIKAWGRIPFLPGPSMPPLKTADPAATRASVAQPNSRQSMPTSITQDNLLMQHYQYLIQQQLQLRQAAAMQAAMGKLSQSEHWNSLPPGEQQRLLMQQMSQQPLDPPLAQFATPKNPVLQLISQMQQQGKVAPSVVPESKISPTAIPSPPLDPLQQLIRDMGGLQPTVPATPLGMQATPAAGVTAAATSLGMSNLLHSAGPDKSDTDPIQSLLRQMGTKAVKPQVDSVWGAAIPTAFSAQNWLQQITPVPPAPPGQLAAASLWALHGKDIKTEQQILEEQQMRAEEERRREEQRKKQEEAEKKQKELEEEKRKQEAEKKRLEEHIKRLEEERKRQEEELKRRKAEEERQKKAAEEERKRQEEAKRLEEEQRKKEEAAKRREEEKKRKEEEKERKRKLEEERKREEEEKRRQEEELARKKQEEEEQARRLEQQRRQAEALRRLQEQQQRAKAAPWSQQPAIQATGGSLIDIQRQEKEKKEREAREREQQQALLQLQQQQQQRQQQDQAAVSESNNKNIQLKWAEKKPTPSTKVKSLSEIQAEEQEQLAKQQERERLERAQQQKDISLPPTASIWGTASQSLNWSSGTTGTNSTPAWGGAGSGNGTYWEEVAPPVQKPIAKNSTKSKGPTPAVAPSGKSGSKTRSKKEEAVVLKLFEQNTQRGDEFYQWCSRALDVLQAPVDIPTFVGFLRDIESPYDVKDYVRMYLGDGKDSQDFARQFLERRSKWRIAQRAVQQDDDMCVPAPAVNPLNNDFQEVKGKGKKTKKSKMFRVDNRILGFNVTAAQDRINVGDRDYGEGI
ncbi:GRB10-interacting GYF protein 2 isoform X1 [Anabrus simplex]|uniref:GRB10-interacting GYF protein 2 isoform X1 n=1 Tax=Anabrus simplex TaxID=316456 RepID=UPI0035A262E2